MNDQDFDRFFRDRLYDHRYSARSEIWRQIRLRWRRRIAGREWRWFCSVATVVIIAMLVRGFWLGPGAAVGRPVAVDGRTAVTRRAAVRGLAPVRGPVAIRGRATGEVSGEARGLANREAIGQAVALRPGDSAAERVRPGGGIGDRVGGGVVRLGEGVAHHPRGGLMGASDGPGIAGLAGGKVAKGGMPRRGRAGSGGWKSKMAALGDEGEASGSLDSAKSGTEDLVNGSPMIVGAGVAAIRRDWKVKLPGLVALSYRAAIRPPPARVTGIRKPALQRDDGPAVWNGWSVEGYGSPDLPSQQFNFSWTAGFRVSRVFAHGWSLTAGLQYSTTNVQRGDWSRNVLFPARFYNLDVPLLLGYSTAGRRIRLSVYAGGILNIISHPEGHPGWPWPSRSGPSAYLGLDLGYRLDERWELFAQPYGRCLFSSGSKTLFPGQVVTEGALFGLRYRLNP